jgi:hypothetical protein
MGKRTPIVHIEWRSRDAERLKHFYKNAFRWKFDDRMPGYSLASTGTKNVGVGVMQLESNSSLAAGIVAFFDSDDLAATEAAVRDAGGQITSSSQPVPGWGRFSLFTDPDGNPLGFWQSEASAKKAEKKHEKHVKKEAKRAHREREASKSALAKEEKKARKAEKKAQKKAEKKAEKKAQPLAVDGSSGKKKKKKAKAESTAS